MGAPRIHQFPPPSWQVFDFFRLNSATGVLSLERPLGQWQFQGGEEEDDAILIDVEARDNEGQPESQQNSAPATLYLRAIENYQPHFAVAEQPNDVPFDGQSGAPVPTNIAGVNLAILGCCSKVVGFFSTILTPALALHVSDVITLEQRTQIFIPLLTSTQPISLA